ncbi:hypothetical protein [Hymenobacter chitinivorans]|uniref:Uncharacterized protein n=1 Tax=Hymenobacter chitinivorans DSM 11115 TaxID=1121954 RepID=A0A2M9BNK0_9BACT|nr:hypothetical protein [Hymenobacter chitinivorans]PJJ59533.1 hypothetical protein CLV45_0952 [Hymenobacter chitinivorans DSM 11115]
MSTILPSMTDLHLLAPEEYRSATLAWVQTIEQPAPTAYTVFEVNGSQLTGVSFPMAAIISLLSTVRVHYIEARFLVIPSKTGGNDQFSIALYAADVNRVRISAYFQAYSWWTTPITEVIDVSAMATDQAPYALVNAWTDAWARVLPKDLKSDMFTTSFGTLEGYTFKADDFLQTLFDARDMSGMDVRIDLALHEYYPAMVEAKNTSLQQTFGLVLRLSIPQTTASSSTESRIVAVATSPFFDLSTPCPPGT